MGKREKDNYFKRLKDQRLTHDEKIGTTIALCVLVPLVVVFNVFIQSALTCTVIMAKPNMAHKNLFMEFDDDKLPYRRKPKETLAANDGTIFDHVDSEKKSSVNKQKGGKRRRYSQKGGSSFDKAANDRKAFMDSTKWGLPYDWAENENFVINSFGEYFITVMSTYRQVYVRALEIVNETFYKDDNIIRGDRGDELPKLTSMGDYVMDWAKVAVLMPIFNQLIYAGNLVVGTGALVWGAINNQGLFGMVFWGIVAFCSIVLGVFSGYFWPYNFMSIYYTISLFKQNFWRKVDIFKVVGNRWKFWWTFCILSWLFVTINWTWATRKGKNNVEYDKQILIGTSVGFGCLFLSMLGIVSII